MMIRWGIYLAFVVLMVYESVIYENVAVSMLMAAAIFCRLFHWYCWLSPEEK